MDYEIEKELTSVVVVIVVVEDVSSRINSSIGFEKKIFLIYMFNDFI
jgi:hypothetical protein